MISKKLQDALNAQINAEMWSAYLYLSMSVEAESKGLKGFGNWFFIQFREEQDHARILMNYLLARGGQVLLVGSRGGWCNERHDEWLLCHEIVASAGAELSERGLAGVVCHAGIAGTARLLVCG